MKGEKKMKFRFKWYLILSALLADSSPELLLNCYQTELENPSDSPSENAA